MLRVGTRLRVWPRASILLPESRAAAWGQHVRCIFKFPGSANVANPGDHAGEKYQVPKESYRPRRPPLRARREERQRERRHLSDNEIARVLTTPPGKSLRNPTEPVVVEEDEDGPVRGKDVMDVYKEYMNAEEASTDKMLPIECERLRFAFDTLPSKLKAAVLKVLKSFKTSQFTMDGIRFSKYLYTRKIPWTEIVPGFEPAIFSRTYRGIPKVDAKKVNETYIESDLPWFEVAIVGKRRVPDHTAIRYSNREAVACMASRLDGHYAASYRALVEISRRDPEFQPQHLLDFGSGLGSATWAAHSIWGKSIKEFMCVDTSSTMTDMGNLLMRGGDIKCAPAFKNVFFRNFMPVNMDVKYDVVVAAHSLSELSSEEDRWKAIETLWQKTEKYLVIVEHGFWPGFNIVREARRIILREKAFVRMKGLRNGPESVGQIKGFRIFESEEEEAEAARWPEGHVFAPCPHDGPCPKERMIVKGTCHRSCNFSNNINCSIAEKNMHIFMAKHHKERLSYVIFKKGPRPEDETKYDRLLRPQQRRGGHTLSLVCRASGELEINTLTRAKNRGIYNDIRRARWGDMLPHLPDEEIRTGRKILSLAPPVAKKVKTYDGEIEMTEDEPGLRKFYETYSPSLADVDERRFEHGDDESENWLNTSETRKRRPDQGEVDESFYSTYDLEDQDE